MACDHADKGVFWATRVKEAVCRYQTGFVIDHLTPLKGTERSGTLDQQNGDGGLQNRE